jgi:nucleoside-diphosphate-sugar epimerase
MKCALTGASGWLGGRIEAALRARGHDVVGLTRLPTRSGDVAFRLGDDPSGALQGAAALVHAAHDFTCSSRDSFWATNVLGGERVLGAAQRAGVDRVVFISSIAAFEGCVSEYGRGKLALEAATLAAGGSVVRPGLCWSEAPHGLYATLLRASRLPLVPVFDAGDQPLRLAHVDDVAAAVVHAVEHGDRWPRLPVVLAHPRCWGFADLLRAMAARQGRRTRTISLPSRLAAAALGRLEALAPRFPVRRDNLVSLLYPPAVVDHGPATLLGLAFRPWDTAPPQ